jgi:hypothetical protein
VLTAAEVDREPLNEAWLLLNAVADLDPPHLKVLRRLHAEGDRYRGIIDYELAAMFPRGTIVLYPILKTLERHGLAGPLKPGRSGDPDGPAEWAIWEFGILLLDRLFPSSGTAGIAGSSISSHGLNVHRDRAPSKDEQR